MGVGRLLLLALYRVAPSRFYAGAAQRIQPGRVVVDVGGARGGLLQALGSGFELGVVVDVDRAHFKGVRAGGLEFLAASGCLLPLRSSCADTVVFHDSLHHMEHPLAALGEAARVLRGGGRLYVFDYDRKAPATRLIAALERALGFPAAFLSPREVEEELRRYGHVMVERRGPAGYVAVLEKAPQLGLQSWPPDARAGPPGAPPT